MSLISLFNTLGARCYVVALSLLALICCFLPLAGHLGFEFAAVLTLAAALFAPGVGVAAMRLEMQYGRPRPGRAALFGGLFAVLALLIPVLIILLNGLRKPFCEPMQGALWVAVLPVPTAWLAATVGALARVRSGSSSGASLLIAVLLLASLLLGLRSIYFGPSFFLMNHFWGYFPGPLYDEVVPIGSAVVLFRLGTFLWGVVALGAAAAHGSVAMRAPRRSWWWLGLAVFLASGSLVAGERLGFRTGERFLAASLGGKEELEGLILHFPEEWSQARKDRLIRDAAFRFHQVQTQLGLIPSQPIKVWVHRSAEEKRRRVGAAATSFAKPWRREIHIHDQGIPHPVLRHELVHALAAEVAKGPFRVPGGWFPNSPLIEGLAVAFDSEPREMTLYQWAGAMRELDLAPELDALLSSGGFLASAPSRAYTYAGAFLRHLVEEFGRDEVLKVYATGKLSSLGDPEELVAGFEAMLDTVEVGEEQQAAAHRRYFRPSVLRRSCAREVSALAQKGRELMAEGKHTAAVAAFERACRMEPDDPALLRALMTASLQAADHELGKSAAERLFAHPKLDPMLHALALIELGDAAWRSGDTQAALEHFTGASKLSLAPSTARAVVARLEALAEPSRAEVLHALFARSDTGLEQLFRMYDHLIAAQAEAAGEQGGQGLVAYLLGRQLVMRGAPERGAKWLESAEEWGLPHQELERENLRLLVQTQARLHQCVDSEMTGLRLSRIGSEADDALTAEWVERCRFEVQQGWEPL